MKTLNKIDDENDLKKKENIELLLSIEEQIELFSEIIIEQLLKHYNDTIQNKK